MNQKKMQTQEYVTLQVSVPKELGLGVTAMAKMKNLSVESVLRLWVEEGLEKDELRFERLLLFAEMTGELDSQAMQVLTRLKTRYFDDEHDGARGSDPYIVRNQNMNHLYGISVQHMDSKGRARGRCYGR